MPLTVLLLPGETAPDATVMPLSVMVRLRYAPLLVSLEPRDRTTTLPWSSFSVICSLPLLTEASFTEVASSGLLTQRTTLKCWMNLVDTSCVYRFLMYAA